MKEWLRRVHAVGKAGLAHAFVQMGTLAFLRRNPRQSKVGRNLPLSVFQSLSER